MRGPSSFAVPEGWLARLAAHPDDGSPVFDDGAGRRFSHLPERSLTIASAIKVMHLLVYTTAVAQGRIDPAAQVRVGD
ncbi:serine hydrolase [Amycolatopsis echigonensis]|uniref:serine hydrolase n=1 Tax=Amycolatopsis echigonensis TaxID=2576905 RepID=UPI000C71395D|nr:MULTISPECIES: serine hydrolase [Amycolatopsis]